MSHSVVYVGLDVHKETIAVAVVEDGTRAEVRDQGEIANTPAALTKLLGKLGVSTAVRFQANEAEKNRPPSRASIPTPARSPQPDPTSRQCYEEGPDRDLLHKVIATYSLACFPAAVLAGKSTAVDR